MTQEGPTSRLARFVSEHATDDVPEEVVHESRRALVDHLGVAVAGSADEVTRRARQAIA